MAFPNEWLRKTKLTIPVTGVSGAQTDFPVMLIWNGTSGNIPSEIYNSSGTSPKADGSDIRFTSDSDGKTELAFEIVTFSPNTVIANARIEIWVKIPSISASTDTKFYMWWRNPSASAYAVTDTYGRNNVWSNNFLGVFHLHEVSGTIATNSVGSNDGTYTGTTFPNRVDTAYGYMQNFVNANGNYVSIGSGSPWTITGNITISSLFTVSSFTSNWQALVAKGDTTYRVARNSSNNYVCFDRSTASGTASISNTADISTGYHYVASTYSSSVGSYCYVDGVASALETSVAATNSTSDVLCIGRNTAYTARDWNGYIGETRISNVARTSTWIAMENSTLLSYSTFITYTNPVVTSINAFPYCGWKRKCALTQVGTQTTATVNGFPVPLIWNGSSGNLPAEIYNNSSTSPMSDGRDIRFSYDAAGTQQIPFEIVTFSPNSVVANARIEIWIGLNVIASTNTTFYIWWNNSQAMAYSVTDPYGRNAVWAQGGFFAVYHMDGSGDVIDSTGNNRTLTNSGTTSSTTALGTARNFVAANRDYLYYNGSYGTPTAVTYSALIDVDSVESVGGSIVSEGDYTGNIVTQDGYLNGFYYNGSTWVNATINTNIVGAGLRHSVYICDPASSIQRILLNAGSEVDSTDSTAISYTGLGSQLMIGRHAYGNTNRDFDGRIDEVWVTHQARSVGWVTNEYNSKVGFATYVTVGTAENVEGIKFDNATTGSSAATPYTFTHTIGNNTNRAVIVCVSIESTSNHSVTSITYNNIAMALVNSVSAFSSTYMNLFMYQLLENDLPRAGTYNVVVTLSGTPSSGSIAGAISLWNVDQRGFSDSVTNTGYNNTVISASITPVAFNSSLVVCAGSSTTGTWSPTNPLIERYDVSAVSQTHTGSTIHDVNPVSTTVTETLNTTSSAHGIIVAAYLPHSYQKYGVLELGMNF